MATETKAISGIEEAPQPSELAIAISNAIDSTMTHAVLIDQVISERVILYCSYCTVPYFTGRAYENGYLTDAGREASTTHILTCDKRPEKQLCDELTALHKALVTFGSHRNSCHINNIPRSDSINKCSCGFDDALGVKADG